MTVQLVAIRIHAQLREVGFGEFAQSNRGAVLKLHDRRTAIRRRHLKAFLDGVFTCAGIASVAPGRFTVTVPLT